MDNSSNYRKISSMDVTIEKLEHEPKDFYCIGVDGGAFVIQDDSGCRSVTGNTLHVQGMTKLFRSYCRQHPRIVNDDFKSLVYGMIEMIVQLEDNFVDLAYAIGAPEGLDKSDVKSYIRYISDMRLIQLGMKPIFGVKDNPLPWLDWVLNGVDHTNFFEGRVTEYEIASSTGTWEEAFEELSCDS